MKKSFSLVMCFVMIALTTAVWSFFLYAIPYSREALSPLILISITGYWAAYLFYLSYKSYKEALIYDKKHKMPKTDTMALTKPIPAGAKRYFFDRVGNVTVSTDHKVIPIDMVISFDAISMRSATEKYLKWCDQNPLQELHT